MKSVGGNLDILVTTLELLEKVNQQNEESFFPWRYIGVACGWGVFVDERNQ